MAIRRGIETFGERQTALEMVELRREDGVTIQPLGRQSYIRCNDLLEPWHYMPSIPDTCPVCMRPVSVVCGVVDHVRPGDTWRNMPGPSDSRAARFGETRLLAAGSPEGSQDDLHICRECSLDADKMRAYARSHPSKRVQTMALPDDLDVFTVVAAAWKMHERREQLANAYPGLVLGFHTRTRYKSDMKLFPHDPYAPIAAFLAHTSGGTVHLSNSLIDQLFPAVGRNEIPTAVVAAPSSIESHESSGNSGDVSTVLPIEDLADDSLVDLRDRIVREVAQRRGQAMFRNQLLDAYNGRCAITDCDAHEALEAAHIEPYRGLHSNRPSNGLLLRADIHQLFDLKLISIDSITMRVVIAPQLRSTTYRNLDGIAVRLPLRSDLAPSREALDNHRRHAGL